MSRLRLIQIMPVVGLATAALVVSGAPSGSAQSTSASLDMPNCHNTIHGVVVDQGGKKVDDVNVEAYNGQGALSASSLSYASPDNETKHGYFDLCVGRGTYTLKLSKDGYKTKRGVDAGYLVWYGTTNRYLGNVKVNKIMEDSTAKVTLSKDTIRVGDNAKGTVKITTTGGAVPTGKWQILVDGDKEDSGKLTSDDSGKFSFSVSGLSKGSHTIKASYDGDDYVNGTDSKKVGIDVLKKKK